LNQKRLKAEELGHPGGLQVHPSEVSSDFR
jgi:hypothetical protein